MATEFSNYRAGERDTTPINYGDALHKASMQGKGKQVKETANKDWRDYRKDEIGAPKVITVQSFGGDTPPPPPPPASPYSPPPPPPPPTPSTYKVKVATPDIILFDDETIPVEVLADLIFENIGGQELLSLSRHDTINGDYVSNQLIKNMTAINQDFSSKRLLSLQNTSDKYFSNFGIKLESKIPFEGNGINGTNVYVDSAQNIVVELVNLDIDEQVEIQLGIGGTIYTVVLGAE